MKPLLYSVRASFVVFALIVATLTMSFRSKTAGNVRWASQVTKLGNGIAEINFTANIPAGWHIYSQSMDGASGPLPTTFEFEPAHGEFELEGKTNELGKLTSVYEPAFEMDVNYYEGTVSFKQRVRYKEGEPVELKAIVSYMLCNENECKPPVDEELTIIIE
jgi:DsbC/DsbD-like thiol-disulfide interchange protein